MASFFKTTIVCILICLDISLLVASNEDFDFTRGSTKRFCGRMLTDSLAVICNSEYQSLTEKRSGKHECTSFFHLVKAFSFHTKMKLIHDLSVFFLKTQLHSVKMLCFWTFNCVNCKFFIRFFFYFCYQMNPSMTLHTTTNQLDLPMICLYNIKHMRIYRN